MFLALLTLLARTVNDTLCPAYAPFFGFMGITAASVFTGNCFKCINVVMTVF